MVIARNTKPSTAIHTIVNEPHTGSRWGTIEEHDQIHPIPEENATGRIQFADEVAAVHKPKGYQESQMTRHQVVRNGDLKFLSEDWRTEEEVSEKSAQYREEFLSMLCELQSMWYDHLGCITVAKHCIDLLDNRYKLVHSATYWAGPKRRDF